MIKEEVVNCFGEHGWLVNSKGFSYEAAQLAYALDVTAWLEGEADAPLALIEGDTGTGKTLGYLVPLLLQICESGKRAVLATHTINLQNQMLDGGDVAVALEYLSVLNKPILKIQQLIGRQEFIDPVRTEAALIELREEGLPAHVVSDLIAAAYKCSAKDGLIETFLFNIGALPIGLSVKDICMSDQSYEEINNGFETQRKEAMTADLVITSHVMLLLNRYFERSALFENDDRKLGYVVVDEADLLPLAAENMTTNKMHVKQYLGPITDFYNSLTKKEKKIFSEAKGYVEDAVSLIEQIDNANQKKSTLMINELGPRYESKLKDIFGQLHKKSSVLLSLLQKRLEILPTSTVEALKDFQKNVGVIEDVLANGKDGEVVGLSWSRIKRIPSIESGIAYPARRISRYFIDRETACRVMFTSATLTNGGKGSFAHFKTSIQSYNESRYCVQSVNAPKSFGDVSFVLTPSTIPKPIIREDDLSVLNESWLEHAVSMINAAGSCGSTLVLCVSFKEAAALAKKLNRENVWCHEQGKDLNEQIARFRAHGGVLLTPSAWEGLSIRGEQGKQLITQLVITRIPYVPPSHFMDKVYQSFFLKSGMPVNRANALVLARKFSAVVRELRQGFGRLIRNKADVGTIWIADARFPVCRGATINKTDTSVVAAVPIRFMSRYESANVFSNAEIILESKNINTMPSEIMTWL